MNDLRLWLFWIFWGIDAMICSIIFVFFFIGLKDGSVSSLNIGIWVAIWVALAVVMTGGFWLKTVGQAVLGTMLLLIVAIPGILYGLFILMAIVTGDPWN